MPRNSHRRVRKMGQLVERLAPEAGFAVGLNSTSIPTRTSKELRRKISATLTSPSSFRHRIRSR